MHVRAGSLKHVNDGGGGGWVMIVYSHVVRESLKPPNFLHLKGI